MIAWAIIIILAVWLIVKYSKSSAPHTTGASLATDNNNSISEETVFNAQNRFEKKFEETYLPDSISGKDIYIYRNLMNKWFYQLAAKHRYDEAMTQKLRQDFLDYMYSTEHGHTSNYLSFELEDEESRTEYEQEARTHGRKTYTIENAFASAIGGGAMKELERIRQLDYSSIDKSGNLAPEGFRFDFEGKLKPVNKKKTVV